MVDVHFSLSFDGLGTPASNYDSRSFTEEPPRYVFFFKNILHQFEILHYFVLIILAFGAVSTLG